MSGFGAEIDGPLVLTRAVHFAAAAMTAGVLMFRSFAAEPALRPSPEAYADVQSRATQIVWTGLAIAAVTGALWLILETMSITGLSWDEAMRSGSILLVVDQTQFGLISEIRVALAVLLGACLLLNRFTLSRWLALLVALGLVAAIAWTGHAGSTPAQLGNLHLAADVLHLGAASAWIGGLIGLLIVFAVGRRRSGSQWAALQLDVVHRFSNIGIVSVAVLIGSGIVNAWILVGSLQALLVTDYGQLLLLKIGAFAIMIGFAAANRLWFTPHLARAPKGETDHDALSALRRNTLIEIALALAIFAIVGILGTLHPAIHLVM